MKHDGTIRPLLLRLLFFVVVISGIKGYAQSKQGNGIPKFRIALTDSSYFSQSDLKKAQPLMLVYFSPDCGHCHDFFREIMRDYDHFKEVQIVMISDHSIPELKSFAKTYDLWKYKNIKVGTEGKTYVVQRHYQVTKFPFIALFDKTGKELSVYRDEPSAQLICQTLKICRAG